MARENIGQIRAGSSQFQGYHIMINGVARTVLSSQVLNCLLVTSATRENPAPPPPPPLLSSTLTTPSFDPNKYGLFITYLWLNVLFRCLMWSFPSTVTGPTSSNPPIIRLEIKSGRILPLTYVTKYDLT